MHMLRRAALFAMIASCTGAHTITLDVLVPEGSTWNDAPAVSTLRIKLVGDAGTREIATVAAKEGTSALPKLDPGTSGSVFVEGIGEGQAIVARGNSVSVSFDSLAGYTLRAFVSRLGTVAELPGAWSTALETIAMARTDERTLALFQKSTDGARVRFYDLATLYPLSSEISLTRAPTSVAARNGVALLLDSSELAWLQLSDGTSSATTVPSGVALGDISEGRTVYADSGGALIVGATRASSTSASVLAVGADGALFAARLVHSRTRAGITFAAGVGLVVCGGSQTDPALEVLTENTSQARALDTQSDPADERACATLANGQVIVAGGNVNGQPAPVWLFDPRCASACAPTPWPGPDGIVASPVLVAAGSTALLIGRGGDGSVVSYELTSKQARKTASIAIDGQPTALDLAHREAVVASTHTRLVHWTPLE